MEAVTSALAERWPSVFTTSVAFVADGCQWIADAASSRSIVGAASSFSISTLAFAASESVAMLTLARASDQALA